MGLAPAFKSLQSGAVVGRCPRRAAYKHTKELVANGKWPGSVEDREFCVGCGWLHGGMAYRRNNRKTERGGVGFGKIVLAGRAE